MPAILSRLVKHREVYMVALDKDESALPPAENSELRVALTTWENVNDVKQLRSEEVARTYRQILVDNRVGVYAYLNGKFIGSYWAIHSGPRVQRFWGGVDFGPDEILLCWGWVGHEFRGHGVFKGLIRGLVTHLRERFGPIRIVADVPTTPLASLIAHRREGFKLTGHLKYVRVLGKLWSQETVPLCDEDLADIIAKEPR